MVEHDAVAVAMADDVVEIGPSGGRGGGRSCSRDTGAAWRADTASGRGFLRKGRARDATATADRRAHPHQTVPTSANLRNIDCEIPVGALTVITGPSGAGKPRSPAMSWSHRCTTAPRKGACLSTHQCFAPIAVDQKPLGNNPRFEPGDLHQGVRQDSCVFADSTGRSSSHFTFNRPTARAPRARAWARSRSASATSPPSESVRDLRGDRYRPRCSTRPGLGCRSPRCWRAASTTPTPCSPSTAR